jgi:demethylmenaquinone methyltransferase/2-methoxy-6-polyprenyl-1,4-benzoquinol methylase
MGGRALVTTNPPADSGSGLPTPGAPEKAAVRSMFDRIAPRYDFLNHFLSAGVDIAWRRRCVDGLDLMPGSAVLDLCTGTADLLIEALARDPSHRGVGVDLSSGMLCRGLVKLRRHGLEQRANLVGGDGERLPLAGGVFDAAMVAFGIRNVGDAARALREVYRVLRPGGRLAVLEFSMPKGVLGRLYRFYFAHVLPRVGGLVSGQPGAYAYLPASVARFLDPEAFGSMMREAGFEAVGWRKLTGGVAVLHRGEKRSVS